VYHLIRHYRLLITTTLLSLIALIINERSLYSTQSYISPFASASRVYERAHQRTVIIKDTTMCEWYPYDIYI